MNKNVFKYALKCGFTTFEFDEYGWVPERQYKLEVIEEIGFLAPKEKQPNNYFEIGRTPNGKYAHSVHYSTGAGGGGYSLHIFDDLFDSNYALFKTSMKSNKIEGRMLSLISNFETQNHFTCPISTN